MYFSKTKNHSILTCNWRRKKRALKSLLNSSVVWRILRDQNILFVRKYLPFYLCFWLYWDKNVFFRKNCIQIFVYCQPRCAKSFFYPNFFFTFYERNFSKKEMCLHFYFLPKTFWLHEYSIMNRIYCFAPSIRVAPSFYIFDLKKCNTYLPT